VIKYVKYKEKKENIYKKSIKKKDYRLATSTVIKLVLVVRSTFSGKKREKTLR
jgi:hypothetical protein